MHAGVPGLIQWPLGQYLDYGNTCCNGHWHWTFVTMLGSKVVDSPTSEGLLATSCMFIIVLAPWSILTSDTTEWGIVRRE